jgi:hypothetical protein
VAEVVIEGDDAVDFSPRAVERRGDERLGGLVDIAELVLQGEQDGQQRPVRPAVLRNDFACAIRTPRFVGTHLRQPISKLDRLETGEFTSHNQYESSNDAIG